MKELDAMIAATIRFIAVMRMSRLPIDEAAARIRLAALTQARDAVLRERQEPM